MEIEAQFKERYARQIAIPEIGEAGQKQLAESSVLIVGAGGLGSPAAFYLAGSGIGILGIIDADKVELGNLQRQILHSSHDLGRPKVESAAVRIRNYNPLVKVNIYPERLTISNAAIVAGYDFIIDATDNFESKFLIADICHEARRPYSHAGIIGFTGQTMTVYPGETACYRCVFAGPPPEEKKSGPPAGPLGVIPGVIGTIQAAEALKHILGIGEPLANSILVFDALAMSFRNISLKRNPACPLCGS